MAAYDHRVVPPPEMPPTPPVVPDGGGGSSSTALTTTGGAVGVPGSLIKTTPEEDAVKREQKMRNDEEARRTRLRGLFKEVITKTCDAMREHVRNSNLEEDVVDDLQQVRISLKSLCILRVQLSLSASPLSLVVSAAHLLRRIYFSLSFSRAAMDGQARGLGSIWRRPRHELGERFRGWAKVRSDPVRAAAASASRQGEPQEKECDQQRRCAASKDRPGAPSQAKR